MKDIYDLRSIVDAESFPWKEILIGIAKSGKQAGVFYGHHDTSLDLSHEQQVWYKSVATSEPLSALIILLTSAKSWHDAWYKFGIEEHWTPTSNIKHFPLLRLWLKENNIFKQIGRQIVFLQLQNANSPKHVDQDLNDAPEEYRKNSEFIWITSETNGKKLFVNNTEAPHITWFNSYREHYTLPESGVRWSLRVDGLFTEEFKEKLKQI
jgi:hypothetical protein